MKAAKKTVILCLIVTILLTSFLIPAHALRDEPTTETTTEQITYSNTGCTIAIKGFLDGSLTKNAAIVLKLRNLTTGDEFIATLYGFNDYFTFVEIPRQGEFEVYSGYIVGDENYDDMAVNIEYVRFRCDGRSSISVPIVIGDINKLKEKPGISDVRLNQPGKPYQNYPTSVNEVIKLETGETVVSTEPVTAETFTYTGGGTPSVSASQPNTTKPVTTGEAAGELVIPEEEPSNNKFIIVFVIVVFVLAIAIIITLVTLKKRNEDW